MRCVALPRTLIAPSVFVLASMAAGQQVPQSNRPYPAPGKHAVKVATVPPNPNTHRAGRLHSDVLSLALEAKQARWQPDGASRPPMTVAAFAEAGKPPLMPGPLVRAPQGTEIRLSVRNSLPSPLTFFVPVAVRGVPSMVEEDSVVVPPGAVGRLTTRAAVPGNYMYRAVSPSASDKQTRIAGILAGAIIIDTAGPAVATRDRVFMIMETPDSVAVTFADTARDLSSVPPSRMDVLASPIGRFIFTINGRSWPKTERIAATVGDSLHWRIINASADD